MNYRILSLIALFTAITFCTKAQTIVTIAGDEISTEDFVAMYKKNNYNDKDKLSPEDYMKLFIDFKLKVKEAESMGLDKDPAFVNELNGYREQLAKPYLVDNATNQMLIEEAYNNMKYDIRASHILINLPKYAYGDDTLSAWNKIMEIRQKALAGENFGELAYKYSDDPSAREREYQGVKHLANKGDLGYFSAFSMIYPFEHVAFLTKVGEISMPVRSDYGYHIIYVTDKQPAMGKCNVAHIILKVPETKTHQDTIQVLERANCIYDSIIHGMSFSEAAKKFSEDESSAKNGGVLIPFMSNQLEANFIHAITLLHDSGQISKPFFSIYGCHIIQLISKEGIGSYEKELPTIQRKITQSDRIKVEDHALYEKLKNLYNYHEDLKLFNELLPTISQNFQTLDSITLPDNKIIFSFDTVNITQADFIDYLASRITNKTPNNDNSIKGLYYYFSRKSLLDYENLMLEDKYPDFRLLMQEYHDGILLFSINEKEVWNKATSDSTELENFYIDNKDNYLWKDRVKATIFKIIDPTAQKQALKLAKKGMDDKELVRELNKKSKSFRITMESGTYEINTNDVISAVDWKSGVSKVVTVDDIKYFVRIYEVLPAGIKSFEECKGLVISDYQSHIDKIWLDNLKNKYSVVVNQQELDKIK